MERRKKNKMNHLIKKSVVALLSAALVTTVCQNMNITVYASKAASITQMPTVVNDFCFDGADHELLVPGAAEGGIILYSRGEAGVTEIPEVGWGEGIPIARDAGTYCVWYQLIDDLGSVTVEATLAGTVTIEKYTPELFLEEPLIVEFGETVGSGDIYRYGWEWVDPDANVGNVAGTFNFKAVYTGYPPEESGNYYLDASDVPVIVRQKGYIELFRTHKQACEYYYGSIENNAACTELDAKLGQSIKNAEDIMGNLEVAEFDVINTTGELKQLVEEAYNFIMRTDEEFAINTVLELYQNRASVEDIDYGRYDVFRKLKDAFEGLTAARLSKMDSEIVSGIRTYIAEVEQAHAAQLPLYEFKEMVRVLPYPAQVTAQDKAAIEAAVAAYEALSEELKGQVDGDTRMKFEEDVNALVNALLTGEDIAAMQAAIEAIEKLPLPEELKEEDAELVRDAVNKFESLREELKALLGEEWCDRLYAVADNLDRVLRDAEDIRLATAVIDKIWALPDVEDIAQKNGPAIKAARAAYESLTKEQKEILEGGSIERLESIEAAYTEAYGEYDAEVEYVAKMAEEAKAKAIAEYKKQQEAIKAAEEKAAADKKAAEEKKAEEEKKKAEEEKKAAEEKKAEEEKKTEEQKEEEKTSDDKVKLEDIIDELPEEVKEAKEEIQSVMDLEVTVTQKDGNIQVKWNKAASADSYDVFVQYCNDPSSMTVKSFSGNTTTRATFSQIDGKGINHKRSFNVYVAAYKKVEGKSVLLAKSHIGRYAGTENSLYSNIKDFTLTKKAYTLTKGATATISAKVILEDEDKIQLPEKYGKTFRYLSTNPDVVTVDGNGTLTAVGSGTCAVYVYAINGMMRQVTVTVK